MATKKTQIDFDPHTNQDAISIIKQLDGNYIGYINKRGTVLMARQGDPTTVLTMLITHPGK